jgi:hypothetical protein
LNCIIQGSRVALRGREARRISLVSPVSAVATVVALGSRSLQSVSEHPPATEPIAV